MYNASEMESDETLQANRPILYCSMLHNECTAAWIRPKARNLFPIHCQIFYVRPWNSSERVLLVLSICT